MFQLLLRIRIISIDISGLEAGTQYRGSFEENVQNLVNEVKEAGNIILFFDEIHQILGAGSTGGDSGSKGLQTFSSQPSRG